MKIFKRLLIVLLTLAVCFTVGYCIYTWGAAK